MILRLEELKNKIYKVYNMRNFMMDIWVWTKETFQTIKDNKI